MPPQTWHALQRHEAQCRTVQSQSHLSHAEADEVVADAEGDVIEILRRSSGEVPGLTLDIGLLYVKVQRGWTKNLEASQNVRKRGVMKLT